MVLIEHQTTVNENMPFRCLSYVAELLNNLVKDKNRLYYKGLITFPKPKFFVFYNGNKNEPLKRKMRLSDAFGGDSDSLELVVTAFNINYGLPQPLIKNCSYLNDYSTLVGKVKEGIRLGHDALQARFDEGRDEGIESVALNMLRRGKSFDDIHDDTNLSLERIKELAENVKKK